MTNWATGGLRPCIPTISGPAWSLIGGAVAGQAPIVLECRLRHFDGAYRSIAGCALPIHEADGRFAGYVGSCSEVSAERGCGNAALERTVVLDGLIAHMNDGVFAETDAGQVAVEQLRVHARLPDSRTAARRDGRRSAGTGGDAAGKTRDLLPGQLLPW